VGREAILTCLVNDLGSYKVSELNRKKIVPDLSSNINNALEKAIINLTNLSGKTI